MKKNKNIRNFTPEPKHIICFIFLLMYLWNDRNVAPEHEALNSVVPQSDSFEEHSFLSSELLPASSRNSLPEVHSGSHADVFLCLLEYLFSDRNVAPGALNNVIPRSDSFEEHSSLSSEFLSASSDGCPATAQSKPTSKETHQYAAVCQFKTELKEKEIADECHSIDGVPKQPESIVVSEEPLGESNECPDVHIEGNPGPQCQSSLEEMEVSASNGIGVRTPRNSVFDPFILSKEEESATFQNNSFELLEQINELKEQLRQTEAENQQLKAELGRHLFLEDKEKRSGKLLSVPRVSASDESRCFRASTSSKCVTTNARLLGGAASLQGKLESAGTSSDSLPSTDKRLRILARTRTR
ncbi:uncharacterized protein [Montipora capricornis]|uniref:uncharacterized protein n=1 Tax=Montipora capricornis TaxID=246305 RepID=UPI0035F1253D